ncbi:hypothetical protein K440DRAFT_638060 [Wilcoxina mikolae CBS 423.85]|nr:hypothetical protein K440DRAFT_638060 [Wilcoxina mikolae CBS 423.85]
MSTRSDSRPHRSDSPDRHRRHHHHRHHRHSKKRTHSPSPTLPLNASPISPRDYDLLTPVFASYLEIQKNISLSALETREAKGRFKSFVSHYNRGELARGWYERVVKVQRDGPSDNNSIEPPPTKRARKETESEDESEDDDDEFGPQLPGQERRGRKRLGPSAPKMEDLELQKAYNDEDRKYERLDLRYERKQDRKAQKERLEELVPRAEPGTRERQLEKKKELNEKMRSFRDKSPVDEVDESTLMGGGGGESLAQKKAALERKKNERELRREQILKARIAEREERVQGMKEKEERTMAMLKSLAASRFGGL